MISLIFIPLLHDKYTFVFDTSKATAFPFTHSLPDRLSGNKLKLVQPELFVNNTNLVELELHDNPWECDCRLKNLVRWAKKRSLLQVRGREGREEGEGG